MTEEKQVTDDELEEKSNKVKFAKPDSMAFRSHYAQQRRKKRKAVNAILVEPVYLPTINYKWTTDTDIDGKRYFIDSGVTPKYPAQIASGSGVKFNGTNQEISTTLSSALSTSGTMIVSGIMTNDNISLGIYDSSSAVARRYIGAYDGLISCGIGEHSYTTDVSKTDVVTGGYNIVVLVWEGILAYVYIDGVLKKEITFNGIANSVTKLDIGHLNGVLNRSGIANNVHVINQALTPTQIAYQYNNPEKFLYREDNVLKSEILTQSEIDNVVAFLPMNEKDEYVRDLANYNETEISDGGVIESSGVVWNGTTATSTSIDSRVDLTNTESLVDTTNKYVIFKVKVANGSISSRVRLSSSQGGWFTHSEITGANEGWYTLYAYITENVASIYPLVYPDITGANTGSIDVLEWSVTVIESGIYPISNYTNSCRDEAINLVYGRQNALLKRDSLGVEYASSFDSMVLDGENRLNLPMTDTELGSKFVFDFVISREEIGRAHLLFATDYTNGMLIRTSEDATSKLMLCRLYQSGVAKSVSLVIADSDFHHIIFENDGTNLTMIVDGVAGTPVAHSFVPSGLKFSDSTQPPPIGPLPQFQIWTEANYDKYDRATSIANGAAVVAQHQGV